MSGRIALVGGDEFRASCVDMDTALIAASGVERPKTLIIPTAAAQERPELAAANGARHFNALGADAAPLMALNARDANDEALTAAVDNAHIVYLTGGNPAYLLDALRGSLLLDRMLSALEGGAILAGSSAGAMVMGQWMRFRGQWSAALGVVPKVVALPHHERSDPDGVLAELSGELPDGATALGIDGASGCIGGADGWRVLGGGAVTVYDKRGWRRFEAGESFCIQP